MSRLNHPNILGYHGFIKEAKELRIIMDYLPGGSLQDVLVEMGPLPKPLIARYAKKLLNALVHIHSLGTSIL